MIIDFKTDPDRACLYDVFDAVTGNPLENRRVFYADDSTGVYRCYLKDENGDLTTEWHNNMLEVAWEERRRANGLRIVLNPKWKTEAEGLEWWRKNLEAFRLGLPNDL